MELLLKFSNPSITLILSKYGSDPRIKGSTILSFWLETVPLLGSIRTKLTSGTLNGFLFY